MTRHDELLILLDLQARTTDFWYDVDCMGGQTAHEFFTEDGVFHASEHSFEGRESIRRFYAWRKDRGDRLSRHVISNLRVVVHSPDTATSIWLMMLYAADGVPVLPSHPPIMIGEFKDECVRGSDGIWRFKTRKLTPLFRSSTPTTVPPKEVIAAIQGRA